MPQRVERSRRLDREHGHQMSGERNEKRPEGLATSPVGPKKATVLSQEGLGPHPLDGHSLWQRTTWEGNNWASCLLFRASQYLLMLTESSHPPVIILSHLSIIWTPCLSLTWPLTQNYLILPPPQPRDLTITKTASPHARPPSHLVVSSSFPALPQLHQASSTGTPLTFNTAPYIPPWNPHCPPFPA